MEKEFLNRQHILMRKDNSNTSHDYSNTGRAQDFSILSTH
jgi:hypothetical protein